MCCCGLQVENPIPFVKSFSTRLRTTGYLHARYLQLLLLPLHLSADWSFECIPLVVSWTDVRNLATLALYAYLVYCIISIRPVRLACDIITCWYRCLFGQKNSKGADVGVMQQTTAQPTFWYARWRLTVLIGFVIAPYFPASNVLFYVGTFIGERLLYFPSVGYCLLIADLLSMMLPHTLFDNDSSKQQTDGCAAPANASNDSSNISKGKLDTDKARNKTLTMAVWRSRHGFFCAIVMVPLLLFYAGRTVLRNQDWLDEEVLFKSALQVCPDSAKVQLNNGILARRYQDYDQALRHFRYCISLLP